jgi:hypothetical protein
MRFVTLSYHCMVQHLLLGVRIVHMYMMRTTTSVCCLHQYMAFNLHLQYVTILCGCMQYIYVVSSSLQFMTCSFTL